MKTAAAREGKDSNRNGATRRFDAGLRCFEISDLNDRERRGDRLIGRTVEAEIDIAEIHGEFSGELTARTKLVVHGTGRVTGTVRYGKLVVAEGGTLNGELKQIDAPGTETRTTPALATGTHDARPQPVREPAN